MTARAFIFARGGSKGLPGKNLKSLKGKSLLQRAIEIARASDSFEAIFVSTDDEAIAQAARDLGAEVIARPAQLAQDDSPEWLAWQHGILWAQKEYGNFDTFVSLPVTSPLRAVEDVQAAITMLRNAEAEICLGITPAQRNPYFNMVKREADGRVQLLNKMEKAVSGRQYAPPAYDITTVVYAAKSEAILKTQALFENRVCAIEIPKERAVDIDDAIDFMLAECLMEARESGAKQ